MGGNSRNHLLAPGLSPGWISHGCTVGRGVLAALHLMGIPIQPPLFSSAGLPGSSASEKFISQNVLIKWF